MIHICVKLTRLHLLRLLALATLLALYSLSSASENEQLEVLFIGNSLTSYNDLPNMFVELAKSLDKTVYADSHTPGGKSLFRHAQDSITLSKIKQRQWDFIILQGSSRRIAYPETFDDEPHDEGLKMLKSIIKKNCASTRILIFMPFAYEDGMNWYQGWIQGYAAMQRDIYDKTMEHAIKDSLSVSPVGWVWYEFLKSKSFPLHYLFLTDWVHPNEKGSYLTACVIYCSIFLEKTFGSSYLADIETTEAQEFQKLADNMVIPDSTKWMLSAYVDATSSTITHSHFLPNTQNSEVVLYQNYPNPFASQSHFKFELKRSMPVHIQIFDISGKSCGVILNEVREQGIHTISLNASDFSNGIYFVNVTAGKQTVSKKFQIQKSHP